MEVDFPLLLIDEEQWVNATDIESAFFFSDVLYLSYESEMKSLSQLNFVDSSGYYCFIDNIEKIKPSLWRRIFYKRKIVVRLNLIKRGKIEIEELKSYLLNQLSALSYKDDFIKFWIQKIKEGETVTDLFFPK